MAKNMNKKEFLAHFFVNILKSKSCIKNILPLPLISLWIIVITIIRKKAPNIIIFSFLLSNFILFLFAKKYKIKLRKIIVLKSQSCHSITSPIIETIIRSMCKKLSSLFHFNSKSLFETIFSLKLFFETKFKSSSFLM
jgi:hypothetical protein